MDDPTRPVALLLLGSELRSVSRAEVQGRVRELTRAMQARAATHTWLVRSGDPLEVLIAALAAWSCGAVVFLPPSLSAGTLREIVATTGCGVVAGASHVTIDPSADAARPPDLVLEGVEEPTVVAKARRTGLPAEAVASLSSLRRRLAQEEGTCARLFTSGTTGHARVFDKSGRQLFGEAHLLARTFFEPDAAARCVLCDVPPHHIYGLLMGVLTPFVAGVPFVAGHLSPRRSLLHLAPRVGFTDLVSVPARLEALSQPDFATLPRLLRVFSSGASLARDCARRFTDDLGLEVCELLGSTETGGVAFRRGSEVVFRPLPGVAVSADAEQRLTLRSPFLPSHAEQPYTTADRVQLSDDGFVHLGRADDVVKVGGKRLALSDLEVLARQCQLVTDAKALAVTRPGLRGTELRLIVCSADEHERVLRQVRAHLSLCLEPTLVPRRILVVERLPHGSTGKLPRRELLALFDRDGKPG